MWKLEEIKNNNIHKSMLKVFEGKRVLFLENSNTLHDDIGNLEIWLREQKIEFNALYDVGKLSLDYIANQISYYDIIAFQTTWTYEVSKKLEEFLIKYKTKKTIVECYICDPSYYKKPKNVIHDIYVLKPGDDDMDEWKFQKLRINKATWES